MRNDGHRRQGLVILGHTGFLGSCLYENFRRDLRCEVRGFSSADINLSLPEECLKLADIIDEDTTVIMAATSLIKSKDFISFKKDFDMLNNLDGIFSLLGVKHLIHLSSIDIYGRYSDSVIVESSRPEPDDFYGLSKLWGEKVFKRVCCDSGIPLTILRPGAIYGSGDNRSVFFRFLKKVQSGEEIEIYGDGSTRLFWAHKMDLYNIVKSAVMELRRGDYNVVSNPEGISLLELAELVFQICGRRTGIKFIPSAKSPINLRFDTSKFRSHFPEIKFTPLISGLNEYLNQTDEERANGRNQSS